MDPPPATLNPRSTLDATGQRINALLHRGLTRIDSNLDPQPDLAAKWQASDHGRAWKFTLRSELKDHGGEPIDAARMAACLENYRMGKPASPLKGAFASWIRTDHDEHARTVTLILDRPQPYAPREVSVLRYFRTPGAETPCTEPDPRQVPIIGSGIYRAQPWSIAPEGAIRLEPMEPGRARLEILFVPDDNARALKLVRGEVDAIQNGISLAKTRWIQREYPERFRILEREGVAVSYLSFNLNDPLLARKEIRQALSLAIDRESIVRNKLFGFGTVAGSLLSPRLPESRQIPFDFDPALAGKLLDRAGFPKRKGAPRLTLHFKSTPAREGIETALMLQEMFKAIDVELKINVVEPAVFLASVRKGAYQIYTSRWVGIGDGSILNTTLRTGQHQNRAHYSNPEMDRLLDSANAEPLLEGRAPLIFRAQEKMMEDLPYFPLWYWSNALVLKKSITGIEASELSLSGGLEPLTRLRRSTR